MGYGSGRGFQALGSGLMGIGNVLAKEKERGEQDKKDREAENLRIGMWASEHGGGLGPAPTVTSSANDPNADLGGTTGAPTRDPRFIELPGGRGYFKRPEVMKQEEDEQKRTEGEKTYQSRLGAITAARPDLSEGQQQALARGIPADIAVPPPAGKLTVDQALDFLRSQYGIYSEDDLGRPIFSGKYSISPEDLMAKAREMVTKGLIETPVDDTGPTPGPAASGYRPVAPPSGTQIPFLGTVTPTGAPQAAPPSAPPAPPMQDAGPGPVGTIDDLGGGTDTTARPFSGIGAIALKTPSAVPPAPKPGLTAPSNRVPIAHSMAEPASPSLPPARVAPVPPATSSPAPAPVPAPTQQPADTTGFGTARARALQLRQQLMQQNPGWTPDQVKNEIARQMNQEGFRVGR